MTQMKIEYWFWVIVAMIFIGWILTSCASPECSYNPRSMACMTPGQLERELQ